MGWSYDRWRDATIEEFREASAGYWRNWEMQTAWLMRELVFTMVTGNPNIKDEDKPRRKEEIIKLSIDKVEKKQRKKKEKKYSPEEIESIRQQLIKQLHGPVTKPNSTN